MLASAALLFAATMMAATFITIGRERVIVPSRSVRKDR